MRWYDDACGAALALELVGERWALLVMRELMFGPRRFGQIRAHLPGVSANVLTQRLEGLEAHGVLRRTVLAPPASVPVYELTPWGYEAEPILQTMGRWAARSPKHDPSLPLSPASTMLSLRTMLDTTRAGDMRAGIAFRFPDDAFVADLADGRLAIRRGERDDAEVIFTGGTMALIRVFYGKRPIAGEALTVDGDPGTAARFIDLFALPPKVESAAAQSGQRDF
ncbi:winged helix-turn-helix transcriptional regulator [Sphingosinicella soli]|uniref:DNA-binding HxlR family transcriptional regulator n=1 Tax=Sphingosinicella soli TaxID=333708 RepID=A0A7W7B3B3_9SPHN|nr:winged helix-turn-helix transcriptional regulator [Sphingosinicella soli]MBB4632313.1 DNA-binding HxlR family transcriptional regulator [Sphingosinicella soli]